MIYLQILGALIVLAAGIHYGIQLARHKSLYPFMPFKYNFRRRRITFNKTLELLNERGVKTMIETGTSRKGLAGARSDGAATIVFGKWAQQNGAHMHSVDISEEAIEGSREEVERQQLQDSVSLHLGDSVQFLEQFHQQVDFLYLDSYDYSRTDSEIQRLSQEHHLKEFKAIEDRLHEQTIVLIDDCGLPGGGKGKTLIEYMRANGWSGIIDAYQVRLLRS